MDETTLSFLFLVVGMFLLWAGAYAVRHSGRSPESPAAGWMSTPVRRRIGGVIAIAWSLIFMALAFFLPRP